MDKSGSSFETITESIAKMTQMISDIADSSQQQLSGIQQINSSVVNLDDMTQQNVKVVDNTRNTSEDMLQQVNKMKQDLSFFKV